MPRLRPQHARAFCISAWTKLPDWEFTMRSDGCMTFSPSPRIGESRGRMMLQRMRALKLEHDSLDAISRSSRARIPTSLCRLPHIITLLLIPHNNLLLLYFYPQSLTSLFYIRGFIALLFCSEHLQPTPTSSQCRSRRTLLVLSPMPF